MKYILLCFFAFCNVAFGHQFTPTYPRLDPSFVDGVLVTRMELFNSRNDIEYYEISVYDGDWNPVQFATESRIVNIEFLKRKTIEVYIREKDRSRAVYICSKSKIRPSNEQITIVSSRICSKIK